MTHPQFVELLLSCEDGAEATKIAQALLQSRLIICAKQLPVASQYWWKGQIAEGQEVLLVMQSELSLFDRIEVEVAKLHSYETFVLQAMPILRVSREATKWLETELLEHHQVDL